METPIEAGGTTLDFHTRTTRTTRMTRMTRITRMIGHVNERRLGFQARLGISSFDIQSELTFRWEFRIFA